MNYVLAIETSCDETAASVIKFNSKTAKVLSSAISSQIDLHKAYGGIVPEVASRAHLEAVILIIKKALEDAKTNLKNIDYFAVTTEPGLIGSLLIGIQTAQTLAWALNKPLIKTNHLDGHFYSAFINKNNSFAIHNSQFPILSLLVSGGHTQLLLAKKSDNIKIIGETLDDAAGEAFDKAAQILRLGYPGGPAISANAEKIKSSITTDFKLPIPMVDSKDFNFSYSGLKTALLYKVMKKKMKKRDISLFAASFQKSLVESLVLKVISAAKKYKPNTITLVGGVAANKLLRDELSKAVQSLNPSIPFLVPDLKYCTDNAAMIGIAAVMKLKNKA